MHDDMLGSKQIRDRLTAMRRERDAMLERLVWQQEGFWFRDQDDGETIAKYSTRQSAEDALYEAMSLSPKTE